MTSGVLSDARKGRTKRNKRYIAIGSVVLLLGAAFNVQADAADGNIAPSSIEVLGDANLYPSTVANGTTPSSACVNNALSPAPANDGSIDWVLDCLANNTLNATNSAAGAKGHWAGFRVLDGIAGNDQDIFLTGGKENDFLSWNPGPGTVGSSKYDITQAYLANNSQNAFFGMERRGNNGTTAFDWEFNKLAPVDPTPNNTTDPLYIPTRSECDVLVTFEMQGSGGSGSAVPFVFRWNDPDVGGANFSCTPEPSNPPADSDGDGSYVDASIAGIDTAINNADTPSAPWGTVDKNGNWSLGAIERFEFAEAKVPLTTLGIAQGDVCSSISRFVQVRTRASSTPNSDLKDLTKIFQFDFFQPQSPNTSLAEICGGKFTFAQTAPLTNTAPDWTFALDTPTTATLTGQNGLSLTDLGVANSKHSWRADDVFSGQIKVNFPQGVDQITVHASQTGAVGTCPVTNSQDIVVSRELGVIGSLTPHCGNVFDYESTVSGGFGTKTVSWSFQKLTSTNPDVWTQVATSSTEDGSIDMDNVANGGQGTYRGVITVTDAANPSTGKPQCQAQYTTNSVNVYDDVTASATLTPDCDGTFAWTAGATGGKAPYDFDVRIQKQIAGVWTNVGSLIEVDNDADGAINGTYDATGSPGRYRVHVDVADDQAVPCTDDANSSEADIRDALTASAAKDASTTVRNSNTAGLNGGTTGNIAGDTVSYQWQVRVDGGTWTNLSGKTAEDITYNGFKTDETTPDNKDFTVDGLGYVGRVWKVELRLHVSRTLNGQLCQADSSPVTVAIIEGVDP